MLSVLNIEVSNAVDAVDVVDAVQAVQAVGVERGSLTRLDSGNRRVSLLLEVRVEDGHLLAVLFPVLRIPVRVCSSFTTEDLLRRRCARLFRKPKSQVLVESPISVKTKKWDVKIGCDQFRKFHTSHTIENRTEPKQKKTKGDTHSSKAATSCKASLGDA